MIGSRVGLALVASSLGGCVALAAPAMGPALSAGGDVLRAGAAHTLGGASYRTFGAPLVEVYGAVHRTLARLEFSPPDEEIREEDVRLSTVGIRRSVRIELHPITPALTQMRVFVRGARLGKDPATASEIVAQIERTLAGAPSALSRGP
jgi:hypothetical protein